MKMRQYELADEVNHTYMCPACRRIRPWCDGGTDSLDCDRCWAIKHSPWYMRIVFHFLPSLAGDHGCGECRLTSYQQTHYKNGNLR